MGSKRKKLKLELADNDEYNTKSQIAKSGQPYLESLPVELLYKLFDYLPLADVLKCRQLNKNLKTVIDQAGFVWLRARLNLEINSSLNINQLNQFLVNRPCLVDCSSECSSILSKEFQRTICPLQLDRLLSVRLSLLEVMSMNCLNMFAQVCDNLQLDAFAKKISDIRSKRSNEYKNMTRLNEFTSLTRLKIRCVMLSQSGCFIWDRVMDNSIFKQMNQTTFASLGELNIAFLNLSRGNLTLFYQSIAGLPSLTSLQLDHCHFYDSHLTSIERELNSFITSPIDKTRLSLRSLTFNSTSVFFIYLFLKYLVNTESLKELSVGARETHNLISNLVGFRLTFILNKYVSDIVSLLNQKCMPNLTSLSTNLFTKYTEANTITAFGKQVIAVSFIESLSINMIGYNYDRKSEHDEVKKMLRGMYHSHYASPVLDLKELDRLIDGDSENRSLTSLSLQLNLNCTKKKKINELVSKIKSKLEAKCSSLIRVKLRLVCMEHKGVVDFSINSFNLDYTQRVTSGSSRCAVGRDNNAPFQTSKVPAWIPPSAIKRDALTTHNNNNNRHHHHNDYHSKLANSSPQINDNEHEDQEIFRQVRDLLNKLTPEKFEKLSIQFCYLKIRNPKVLRGIIVLILEKALAEPAYSALYAQLCQRLDKCVPNFEPPATSTDQQPQISTFRRLLLTVCQHEFDNRASSMNKRAVNFEDEEYVKHIAKKKMLGNVKFIGELGNRDLLSRAILHKCIKTLLEKQKDETYGQMCDDLECLCRLLTTVGKKLDEGEARKLMDQYFERMRKLRQVGSAQNYAKTVDCLSPRIRFMIQDVIDLRQNAWIAVRLGQREQQAQPKRINELRESLGESENTKFSSNSSNEERENSGDVLLGAVGGVVAGATSVMANNASGAVNSAFMVNMLQQFSQQPNMSLLNAISTLTASHKQQQNSDLNKSNNYAQMLLSPNYYAEEDLVEEIRVEESNQTSNTSMNTSVDSRPAATPTPPSTTTTSFDAHNTNHALSYGGVISSSSPATTSSANSTPPPSSSQRPLSNGSANNDDDSGGKSFASSFSRTNGPRKQTVLQNFNENSSNNMSYDQNKSPGNNLYFRSNQNSGWSGFKDQQSQQSDRQGPPTSNTSQRTTKEQYNDFSNRYNNNNNNSYNNRMNRKPMNNTSQSQQGPNQFRTYYNPKFGSYADANSVNSNTNAVLNNNTNTNNSNTIVSGGGGGPTSRSQQQETVSNNTQALENNNHRSLSSTPSNLSNTSSSASVSASPPLDTVNKSNEMPANEANNRYRRPYPSQRYNNNYNQGYNSGANMPLGANSEYDNLVPLNKPVIPLNKLIKPDAKQNPRNVTNPRTNGTNSPYNNNINYSNSQATNNGASHFNSRGDFKTSSTTSQSSNSVAYPSYSATDMASSSPLSTSTSSTSPLASLTGPMSSLLLAMNTSVSANKSLLMTHLPISVATAAASQQAKQSISPNNVLSKEMKEKFKKLIDDFLNESGNLNDDGDGGDENNNELVAKYLNKFNELKLTNEQTSELIYLIIVSALSRSDKDRLNASRLFVELNQLSVFNQKNHHNDLFMNGLKSVLQNLSSLECEYHFVKSNVSLFAARGVCDQIIAFADLAALMKHGAYYPLFFLCMQNMLKLMIDKAESCNAHDWLRGQLERSRVNLVDMLPGDDRSKERLVQILEDRELAFVMPMLKIESVLFDKVCQEQLDCSQLKDWIESNVDTQTQASTDFIQSLVTCVVKNASEKTVLNSGQTSASKVDKQLVEEQKKLIAKYKDILYPYLASNSSKQVEAIYAMQVYAGSKGFPKYFLAHLFNQMYDLELIEEEAFYVWKDEINENYPNKGQALFHLQRWFNWLQEASEESTSSESESNVSVSKEMVTPSDDKSSGNVISN